MIPNLFIVGAPKCGTSSLHEYLRQHPEIFMTDRKEIHYFDKDLHSESDRFHGRRLNFFYRTRKEFMKAFETSKGEKILGESSPTYLVSKVAADLIHKFNPKSKIIIVLREPVDLIYSFHSQLFFNQDENIEDFMEALDAEEIRKKTWKRIPKTAVTPSFLFYSEFVKYTQQIKRYQKLFKHVKIILLDDLKKDSGKVCKEIFEFLGVDSQFQPNLKRINVNTAVSEMSISDPPVHAVQ